MSVGRFTDVELMAYLEDHVGTAFERALRFAPRVFLERFYYFWATRKAL